MLSLSFWFVIPAGAVMGGMAAASGYYATARLTQTMPSRTLLFNMVAVAVTTWFLSKWASYAMLKLDDGTRVADLVPFWEYFKVSTRAMKLSVGTRGNLNAFTTGELGTLGYAREGLQLLGFIVGGIANYVFLRDVEACESCKRYAKTESLLNAVSPAEFDRAHGEANVTLPNLVERANAVRGGKAVHGASLVLARCPRCHDEWLQPALVLQSGNTLTTTKLGGYRVNPEIATTLRAKRSQK